MPTDAPTTRAERVHRYGETLYRMRLCDYGPHHAVASSEFRARGTYTAVCGDSSRRRRQREGPYTVDGLPDEGTCKHCIAALEVET